MSEPEIDIIKYASYRRKEIDLLNNDLFLSKENKQKSLFQLLPRHMRRRTMGYIRKRLPHRIRKQALIKPASKVNKRPSRKYRRRASNLLKEYSRRQNEDKVWLETHIWHAKRFHMCHLYGYKLALHDNCKSKRNVYKCLKDYSLIHDESYLVCNQLIGLKQELLTGLARLCSPQTGLTFSAKISLDGKYEGQTVLYEMDKFPFNCIGPCKFMWKSSLNDLDEETKTLWIWTHPSIYKQLQTELIKIFNLVLYESDSPLAKKPKLESKSIKLEPKVYISELNTVKLTCLKDKLVRFKLLGPMSTQILANVLNTVNLDKQEELVYKAQNELWENLKNSLKNPNQVVTSTILSLLVKDPRFLMPKKKNFNKIKQDNDLITSDFDNPLLTELRQQNLSKSFIWDFEYTENLKKNKKKTFEINKLRSEYLIPGVELKKLENHSKIPVILIQNQLNSNSKALRNRNLMTGWDLILPSSWSMSFWTCLIHNGARAIGLNELDYLLFESGNSKFPNEFIDTESARVQNENLKHELFKKYLSRPASKRVNYLKKTFLSPFYAPCKSLVNLNIKQESEFYVLRSKNLLLKLHDALFNKKPSLNLNDLDLDLLKRSYIGVRLSSIDRGTIQKYSLLYSHTEANKEQKINNFALNKTIKSYKTEFLSLNDIKQESLNSLLKKKFNKYKILLDEKYFMEYNCSAGFELPIGFVCSNGYTLVNGKCSANGYILTKYVLDLVVDLNCCKNNKTLLNYKSPDSADCFNKVKIENFF